jgi:hypothetical protein
MNIISFTWDNSRGEPHNGTHLFVGQHLPLAEDEGNSECVRIYGICVNIVDPKKDFQLHEFSCHNSNLKGEIEVITKANARKLILEEIDKALDILYDHPSMKEVNDFLNKPSVIDSVDDED